MQRWTRSGNASAWRPWTRRPATSYVGSFSRFGSSCRRPGGRPSRWVLGGLWTLFAAASLVDGLRSLPLRLRWNWLLAGRRSRTDAGRQASVRIVLRVAASPSVGAVGVLVHASQDSRLEANTLFDELIAVYIGLLVAALGVMRFQWLERSVRRYAVPWIALGGTAGACLAGFAPFSPDAIGIVILAVVLLGLAALMALLGGRDVGRTEITE